MARSPLPALTFLLIAGVFAGAQLGKIAPLIPFYRDTLGFSLVVIGWLTSAIGLFVAVAALPTGFAIERAGPRASVIWGSLALGIGALALPFLTAPGAILAARLVEGVGYVILVIALPAAMTAIAPPAWRATVLALWSCFVPAGFALADFLGLAMLDGAGATPYLLANGIGFALSAAIGIVLLAGVPDIDANPAAMATKARVGSTINRDVVLIAGSFGVWVILTVAFFAFMPAYIAADGRAMLVSAGVIALMVPIGNVAAGALVGGRGPRFIAWLGAAGLVGTAALAWPAFGGADGVAMTLAAAAIAILGGVTGSALYAAIPLIVPRGGSVSIAIGCVAQAGGLGTLFGPPLAAAVIERAGWAGFAIFEAVLALVAAAVLLPILFAASARRQ